MKRLNLLLAALLATTFSVMAADKDWLTDLEEAKKIAAKENKSILIDFTGSDWCGWCIKLKKEVFSQKEFTKEASKHFVLVELDFPQKSKQTKEEKATNKALAKKYKIAGFPSIVLTDAKGKKYAQTGYLEGGPKPYLKHLNKLRDRKDLE